MDWILWGGIAAALIVLILFNGSRRRKAEADNMRVISEIKVGDKVKTHIGVYGKIKSIVETTDGKVAIIETGGKVKVELEVDFRIIAGVDNKDIVVYDENNNIISRNGIPVALEPQVEAQPEVTHETTLTESLTPPQSKTKKTSKKKNEE